MEEEYIYTPHISNTTIGKFFSQKLKFIIGRRFDFFSTEIYDEEGRRFWSDGADDVLSLGTIEKVEYQPEFGRTVFYTKNAEMWNEDHTEKTLTDAVFCVEDNADFYVSVVDLPRRYDRELDSYIVSPEFSYLFGGDYEETIAEKIQKYLSETAQEVKEDFKAGKTKPYIVGGIACLLLYKLLK